MMSHRVHATASLARRFHPEARTAWAHFSLPEFLLLTERLSRDVRREALRHIPAVRAMRLSHLLWVHRQNERYGAVAQTGCRMGFGLWRVIRAALNPLQAAGQETSGLFMEKTTRVLSYRLRAYATRLLVLEIGRASIDLYPGRLALSDEDLRAARESDMAATADAVVPIRIVLIGQVNAGKSSLLNALAQEIRCAVGPLPTTSNATENLLDLDGRPCVMLVELPDLDESTDTAAELLVQAERADLIMWVASATQPARGPDRKRLDDFRAWADAQLARRPPAGCSGADARGRVATRSGVDASKMCREFVGHFLSRLATIRDPRRAEGTLSARGQARGGCSRVSRISAA